MIHRLLELGKSVLAESDLDGVLAAAVDGVIELCRAERGMILLFDERGETIFQSARHLDREDIEKPQFEVSRTIIERVRSGGEAFWHPNVLDDPTLGDKASVTRLMLLSVACQPIRHEGSTLGVVYLDNRSVDGMFGGETAELLSTFSDFISVAAHNALDRRRMEQRIESLSGQLRERYDFDAIVGQAPEMLEALKLVGQVADSDATVLIRGESGTGKELIARALHFNSRRRQREFVAVNCGALPDNLLEAELFGHKRGAFTGAVRDNPGWFERAQGGTLLLDEVGELAPALQVKLLRVLESGEYSRVGSTRIRHADARILAATHRDLEELQREGAMRQDFLYRLNVLEVRVPPLRRRRGDIPLLARHFLARLAAEENDRGEKRLSPGAEELLLRHDYPGNVRELQNALQRGVLLAEGPVIEARHLPESLRTDVGGEEPSASEEPVTSFKAAKQRVVERFERDFISRCLRASDGNITRAAKAAELDYKNFHGKMRRYGIEPADFKR